MQLTDFLWFHARWFYVAVISCGIVGLWGFAAGVMRRPLSRPFSIARALASNPELILADEPTGELDSATAREILSLFSRIVDEEQVTLLMASHDALVDEYADEILQLKDGQIV